MFGMEWCWMRDGGYGFVKLELGAHHGWKNIDGGKGKVGIGMQVVGDLVMEELVVTAYNGCFHLVLNMPILR